MNTRLKLTYLWYGWGLLLFVLLIALSMQPRLFGSGVTEAWQWFLPNIMPVLTLVGAGSYAAPASTRPASGGRSRLVGMAFAVSLLYLATLSVSVIGVLVTPDPLAFLRTSNLWLGPLQGLATSVLGLFFIRKG